MFSWGWFWNVHWEQVHPSVSVSLSSIDAPFTSIAGGVTTVVGVVVVAVFVIAAGLTDLPGCESNL